MRKTTLAGRYQIVRHLGGGGFGQTFLARDAHLPGNPECVVKRLQPQVSDAQTLQTAKRLFDREAQTLYQLGVHAQIPGLLAHFEENGEFYLVQEYIPGQPLDRELSHGKQLHETQVMDLLRDILKVLAFVHQQQVIHRDIKPANLIGRASDGKIVLIDFGAVKAVSNRAASNHGQASLTIAVGSPGYMPSEQMSGQPHFSSDIYAVGMVCLQALSGERVRNIPQDERTGEFCCAALAPCLSISPGLATVLDRMVRYDYRQRYPSATEALQALEELLGGDDAFTIPMPPTPPPRSEASERTITIQLPENQPIATEPSTAPGLSRQSYRNRQILLNKVKNYWVKGVLETSLHGRSLIELGLTEKLDAVERPWGLVWESCDVPQQQLPPGTRVIDKFDQLGEGRSLLILGKPGSGKTTSLLELTRDLISRAETDLGQAMPVVFNLSSWNNQAIADWLVQELHSKYQVSQDIGKTWVAEERQMLLLLDGLDEVSAERREACVDAINQFMQSHGQTELVVCSRIGDYEVLSRRLQLQAAIYLQPLTDQQIQQYFKTAGEELAEIRTAIATDATLQELTQCPLLLNIIALAYQGMSVESLPSSSLSERRHHLFNTYIERMFNRKGASIPYSQAQAKQWLMRLAQQMVKESQTVFLIERMQPSWLETRQQKWIYTLSMVLIGTLVAGVGAGLIFGMIYAKVRSDAYLIQVLACGLIGALIFFLVKDRIEPVENISFWSYKRLKDNLFFGLRIGLIAGVIFGLAGWAALSLIYQRPVLRIMDMISAGLVGLDAGLIVALIRSVKGGTIGTSIMCNQGIWQSGKNAAILTVMAAITWGIIAKIIIGIPMLAGVIAGMALGLFSPAGIACIQHVILRLVLYFNRYIPWNYARFLDYATQLIFLQKVGGGYIFIHRLLLEHFAEMKVE
ncbi:MAG: protein kinase [Hormoscilla sp.]